MKESARESSRLVNHLHQDHLPMHLKFRSDAVPWAHLIPRCGFLQATACPPMVRCKQSDIGKTTDKVDSFLLQFKDALWMIRCHFSSLFWHRRLSGFISAEQTPSSYCYSHSHWCTPSRRSSQSWFLTQLFWVLVQHAQARWHGQAHSETGITNVIAKVVVEPPNLWSSRH